MSNVCSYEEGCSLPSSSNEIEILIRQLKREVAELMETTKAKFLKQEGKIAEICVYLKANVSNELRSLLDSMVSSGEINDLITSVVSNEIELLQNKLVNELDPEEFDGESDFEKLQNAINRAIELISNKIKCVVKLNRIYDITGKSLRINKPITREKLVITGLYGGIRKDDEGFMFKKGSYDYVTDFELRDTNILSITPSKTNVIKSPDFINVTFSKCKIENINIIVDSEMYMQNIHLDDCLVTGGSGDLFRANGFYGLFLKGNTIEHRTNGYVINQRDVVDGESIYNRCFNIDVTNNLIEGFTDGGIANLYRITKVNISNNYFEAMVNNIVLNAKDEIGSLIISNNRLFVGVNQVTTYGTRGFLNVISSIYPNITMNSNMIENSHLIFMNGEFSRNSKIIAMGNDVVSANTSNGFTSNQTYGNPQINKFPLITLTSDNTINKYDRNIVLISDIEYSKTLNGDGNDVVLTLVNGLIKSIVTKNVSVNPGRNNVALSYGVPIHLDDMISNQVVNDNVDLMNQYRVGSGNSKQLNLKLHNVSDTITNVLITSTAIINTTIKG